MKILELKEADFNYRDYIKRAAKESDYSVMLRESCIGKLNGEIKFIYDKLDLDSSEVVGALRRIEYQKNERTEGLVSTSRVFGYKPRIARRADYCSVASLALDFPREHSVILKFGELLEERYRLLYPDGWTKHAEATAKVRPSYKINGTVFTSGIINKNNPLNYHFDAGNFKKVYSCMIVFKHDVGGGFLSIPEYDVGIELKNNSLFMFDGQSIMHGVTPIKYNNPNGYRFSIVYYSLEQIWKCLEIDEELARIKNLKTERERKRVKVTEEYKEQFRKRYRTGIKKHEAVGT